MLTKAKDFITWGEIDAKTLEDLIRERGRMVGGAPITDSYVDEKTDYDSISSFAAAIIEGKTRYKDLPGAKPLFRLHPPKGGLESIKHHHSIGGSLGYRGDEINSFVRRML
jgi:large subunit ribosomal protein L30